MSACPRCFQLARLFHRDLGRTLADVYSELMTERGGHPCPVEHPQWTGPLQFGPPDERVEFIGL